MIEENVMRLAILAAAALFSAAFLSQAFAGEIVQRAGERPREMPNNCNSHLDDDWYGHFQGIGQIGLMLDQPIYEAGCFPTKKRCTTWLYNIRSDHGAGERAAGCKRR